MSDLSPEADALVQQFTAAVADLNWTSETDAPFDIALWTGLSTATLSAKQVLQQVQLPPETLVEVVDLDTFFAPTAPQPWHIDEEQAIAEQFQMLQMLLHQTLEDIQVYRCGKIELEIYIVGRTISGDWIALHTNAVET
jgi:Nuclease A inhibitor-like protein